MLAAGSTARASPADGPGSQATALQGTAAATGAELTVPRPPREAPMQRDEPPSTTPAAAGVPGLPVLPLFVPGQAQPVLHAVAPLPGPILAPPPGSVVAAAAVAVAAAAAAAAVRAPKPVAIVTLPASSATAAAGVVMHPLYGGVGLLGPEHMPPAASLDTFLAAQQRYQLLLRQQRVAAASGPLLEPTTAAPLLPAQQPQQQQQRRGEQRQQERDRLQGLQVLGEAIHHQQRQAMQRQQLLTQQRRQQELLHQRHQQQQHRQHQEHQQQQQQQQQQHKSARVAPAAPRSWPSSATPTSVFRAFEPRVPGPARPAAAPEAEQVMETVVVSRRAAPAPTRQVSSTAAMAGQAPTIALPPTTNAAMASAAATSVKTTATASSRTAKHTKRKARVGGDGGGVRKRPRPAPHAEDPPAAGTAIATGGRDQTAAPAPPATATATATATAPAVTAASAAPESHACLMCKFPATSALELVRHEWEAHRRIRFSNFGSGIVVYGCSLCGKGSGVVYPTIDGLCKHVIQHIRGRPLHMPEGSRKPP